MLNKCMQYKTCIDLRLNYTVAGPYTWEGGATHVNPAKTIYALYYCKSKSDITLNIEYIKVTRLKSRTPLQ